MALNQQRYRATHQRANDAAAVRRDDEARAQAASTGAWLPVEALQRAISDASDQRTARDAYAGLRRRAGVRSPEELVMHLTRRLFVAAIFAVPEDEALDEREPKAEVAPRVVRPLVNRAPRSRAGSHALHEALRQAEAAGA